MAYDRNNRMWAEACALLAEAERLQHQFFRPATGHAAANWEPPMDLLETDSELLITVALPGVTPERVEIHLNAGQLSISGVRPLPIQARNGHIHRLELPYGRFERRISLPTGHYELTRHELVCGCLHLNLRKLA